MRLFFAINFNSNTRKGLLSLRDELRSLAGRGRFSSPENLHLTLAFLGECDIKRAAEAKAVLRGISFEPFDIAIDRVGRFRRSEGDIWWAGLRQSDALLGLQSELSERLTAAGFALERRRYSPHITLARELVTGAQPWSVLPFGETVRSVELMKSERIDGKLTYTKIESSGGM